MVNIVRDGCRGGNGQASNHGKHGGEGHCGNNRHEDRAANLQRKQWCRGISPARRGEDAVRTDQGGGAVSQDQGHQIEGADDDNRPGNRTAGFSSGRHGVEAHQHVRQAAHTKHQRNAQGDEIQLGGGGGAVFQARGHDVFSFIALLLNLFRGGVHINGVVKQRAKSTAQCNEYQEAHDDYAGY